MRPDEVRRTASYASFAEEGSIQLSSISVRVCRERCLTAEEYSLHTGFDHVEGDLDDYFVSSLSASKRAGIPSKERRGASKVFLRQLRHQEHSSI